MRVIKIAVTGPESSGKSVLARDLAAHYRTTWAPEYAREYLSDKEGVYDLEDLDRICRGQIRNEERALHSARELCFFDTDMLVLKVWSEFRFGVLSPQIRRALTERTYDLRLLCKPDLPWEPDPLRESPEEDERYELFEIFRTELKRSGSNFSIVSGKDKARFDTAVSAVSAFIEGIDGKRME